MPRRCGRPCESPALIVLDLGLPDLSGLEVARRLREHPLTARTPVVALTGHSGPAEEQACLAAGCTQYFAKPIEPRKLLDRLPSLLRGEVGKQA